MGDQEAKGLPAKFQSAAVGLPKEIAGTVVFVLDESAFAGGSEPIIDALVVVPEPRSVTKGTSCLLSR